MTGLTMGSATIRYTYDAAGNLISSAMPNGVTESRAYDGSGQLTSVSDAKGSTVLDSYALTLNPAGQPTQTALTQNSATQPTWYYTYDASGRLATACASSTGSANCSTGPGGGETAWTYDKAGNILTQVAGGATTTSTYNAAEELTQAVTGNVTTTYSYDADGNLTATGANTYSYNAAGELTQATSTAGTYVYAYDSSGNLTSVSQNGTVQQNVAWDVNSALPLAAVQTDSSGATTADYLYGPGGLASMATPGGTYYPVTDWVGSVTGLIDSTGTQVSVTSYSPYGSSTTTNLVQGAPASAIGFAGAYTLPGSGGLDDMRARDYNPATGEFTSGDPMGLVTGQPYAYAYDAPLSTTDPSGTFPCPSWICTPFMAAAASIHYWISRWWQYWWTDNPCNNAALTPAELAQQVAEATGGTLDAASKDGYKITIPYGNRGIMIRVMNGGYYRISIPGKETFTVEGEASVDQALTHIPITDTSLQDILSIISRITE